jgi:hypothetical protein
MAHCQPNYLAVFLFALGTAGTRLCMLDLPMQPVHLYGSGDPVLGIGLQRFD